MQRLNQLLNNNNYYFIIKRIELLSGKEDEGNNEAEEN
jgi:hypothetical protein